MSSRVHGETTALNVISQTPLKSREGQQTNNEPNKRELIARVQALTQQINDKESDIERETDKLKKMLEAGDLVDERQLSRVVRSLGKQVEELRGELDKLNVELAPTLGGDEEHAAGNDSGPTIVVSFGYVAQAQQALNALQVAYTQLQQLQRKINASILDAQRSTEGRVGTIQALANAAQNSAYADAVDNYLEAGKDAAQVFTTGVNMGYNIKQMKNLNEDLNAPEGAETKLNQAKDFQQRLHDAEDADGAIGDDLPELEDAQQDRMRDLVEGAVPYKIEADDGLVLDHIQGDDDLRAQANENIGRQIHDAELEKNSRISTFQTDMQTKGLLFQMANQASSAVFAGLQGQNKVNRKGPAEAYRSLAQYSNEQVGAAISTGTDQARTIDEQSLRLNSAKENIGSQSQRGS